MKRLIRQALFLFSVFVLGTVSAQACSVCFIGDENSRFAYYFTTGLLSLLPLAMIGSLAFYIAKKYR